MDNKSLLVPALRGRIGSWAFYNALITWDVAVKYITIAEDIVENKELSKMIQRQVRSNRKKEIANYILQQDERFFGSLVAAVYKGKTKWHQLGGFKDKLNGLSIPAIELSDESFGYLELTGCEIIFALDGQHRLVGIEDALKRDKALGSENLGVLFVGHENTSEGLKRSRRLFTTLNKKAVPVKKGEIIALDEDDVAAILTRRLVETESDFKEAKISYVANNRMPDRNNYSFTTIGALYDAVRIIITTINRNTDYGIPYSRDDTTKNRPANDMLDQYYKLVKSYLKYLKQYFPEFDEYCQSIDYKDMCNSLRCDSGGHILFRPQGFLIITKTIEKLTGHYSLRKAVKLTSKLPHLYQDDFFRMLIWNPVGKTVVTRNEILVRDLFLYALDCFPKSKNKQLLDRYRRVFSQEERLPNILDAN